METLTHKTGKNFVPLAGLQKKTEINVQINLRDINNKHAPLQALSRSDHTTHSCCGRLRELWTELAAASAKIRRGGVILGKNRGGKTLLTFLCIFCCSVLLFLYFKCHSPNRMSTPTALVVWDLLFYLPPSTWRIIVFFFCALILAWLCYGCYPSMR